MNVYNKWIDTGKVFRLLASGYVTKEIADELDVSGQRIIREIGKKKQELNCRTLPQLMAVMTRKNLL